MSGWTETSMERALEREKRKSEEQKSKAVELPFHQSEISPRQLPYGCWVRHLVTSRPSGPDP